MKHFNKILLNFAIFFSIGTSPLDTPSRDDLCTDLQCSTKRPSMLSRRWGKRLSGWPTTWSLAASVVPSDWSAVAAYNFT